MNCQPFNYIQRILYNNIPLFFRSKINEINSIYSQPRLEYMHNCFNETEIKAYSTEDIEKCKDWCEKYGIHFTQLK